MNYTYFIDNLCLKLKEGNASGVLTGGVTSDFEHQVIKERWKLIKKKMDKEKREEKEETEGNRTKDQCDMVNIRYISQPLSRWLELRFKSWNC